MKKLAIAGASVALAALPVAGVFAANGDYVVDTVQITISASCGVASTSSNPVSGAGASLSTTMVNGSTHEWVAAATAPSGSDTGGSLYVTCNDASGWHVSAQGYSNDTDGTTDMVTTTTGATAIPTGTTLDGTVSAWAFKIANDGIANLSITNGYTDWSQIPGNEPVKIASLANAATSNGHIYTGYKVSVSPTQQAATYTGKVKYTVSAGVGN